MSAAVVAACLLAPATATAASPRVAALQVALRAHGVYAGAVDGLNGPGTGGTGIFPAAVGAGLGGGFWEIGHAQDDELPPFAGRKGQVDPTV